MALTLSPQAVERILHLKSKEPHPKKVVLRLMVLGGGCSGFQYKFSLENQYAAEDKVFEQGGAKLVIDEASLAIIDGSEVHYHQDLSSAMFIVKNPNATSSCGCGNSFSL